MSTPNDPLRLDVIDRVVEVLEGITSGASYFYTPAAVSKRFIHWAEVKGTPVYMVSADSGGTISYAAPDLISEEFYINVKGIVQDKEDVVAALERALRDVRVAILADTEPTAGSGSLGELGALVFFDEPPTTDNGYLSAEGLGFFEQRIRIHIASEWS
jgi:hypothetical protein